jgi:hypothetical protein
MKKSEIYQYAQCAIIDSPNLMTMTKLEVLRELMAKEDVALFVEQQEAEKANEAVR